ncbi:6-bladed beta-propeller [Pigmentiphaga humi]|nr:6-bladed beta-propeller [Pigmentiphaga humi]
MRASRRFSLVFLAGLAAGVAFAADDVVPTNDLPNPYRAEKPWGKLPGERAWGAVSAVAVDNDGRSVWVGDRCGPHPKTPPGVSAFAWDSCAESDAHPIHHLSPEGAPLLSFGGGRFVFPHKVFLDKAGNVWVADNRSPNERELKANPASAGRGHAVYKFDRQGRLLMTIGTPGKAGDPPEGLNEPNSIAEAPNGDILISEGHSGQAPASGPGTVARISRYTKDGKYIGSFGQWGYGPGEFRTPHDIVFDDQGRLLVADRGNMRIQVFDEAGKYLAEWKQYSRPSAIALANGKIYVADSESNGTYAHPGWERGIRVGDYKTGEVLYRIPDVDNFKGTSSAEGVAVDAQGNIYAAEVGARQMVKYTAK